MQHHFNWDSWCAQCQRRECTLLAKRGAACWCICNSTHTHLRVQISAFILAGASSCSRERAFVDSSDVVLCFCNHRQGQLGHGWTIARAVILALEVFGRSLASVRVCMCDVRSVYGSVFGTMCALAHFVFQRPFTGAVEGAARREQPARLRTPLVACRRPKSPQPGLRAARPFPIAKVCLSCFDPRTT